MLHFVMFAWQWLISFSPMKKGYRKASCLAISFFYYRHQVWLGLMRRMLMVSEKLPRSMVTVPLLWAWVTPKGPLVGFSIFGWPMHSFASNAMRTWSPMMKFFSILVLFSQLLDAAMVLLHSCCTFSQSMAIAFRKIIYWLNTKWHGEYFNAGLIVICIAKLLHPMFSADLGTNPLRKKCHCAKNVSHCKVDPLDYTITLWVTNCGQHRLYAITE